MACWPREPASSTRAARAKAARQILFPRFKGYRQKAGVDLFGNWINDAAGAFAESIDVRGIKVGIVGANTAWLSKEDKDKERLTPGFELIEVALSTRTI
jgi:hypothetical protein